MSEMIELADAIQMNGINTGAKTWKKNIIEKRPGMKE